MISEAALRVIGLRQRHDSSPGPVPSVRHLVDEGGRPRFTIVETEITMSSDDERVIVVGYQVFEVVSWDEKSGALEWQDANSNSHPDGTDDLAKAEVFLECSVKWDGCSNWSMGDHHFCSSREAKQISWIMDAVYEMASCALPDFDDNDNSPRKQS
jgi:hypothetical protein